MTYPHATDLEPLGRDLKQLRYSFQDLHDGHDRLGRRLDELYDDHTRHVEQVDSTLQDLRDELFDQGQTLRQSRIALKHLIGRVDWLEHHVRATAGLTSVDLDRTDTTLRVLIRRAHAGARARAGLLSQTRRTQLTWVIRSYEQTQNAQLEYIEDALRHSTTIASSTFGNNACARATAAFRGAHQQANALADQLNRDRQDYTDARAQLANDDQQRTTADPIILAGQRARTRLQAHMRHRITTAVTDRQLLPTWFTTTLGYSPPAEEPGDWLNAATELLTYRLIYDIRDELSALGSPPVADRLGQRQWHDELTATLQRVRQGP